MKRLFLISIFFVVVPLFVSADVTQQNVLASRAVSTVYRNTTGSPMFISVVYTAMSEDLLRCYTDSSASPTTIVSQGYALNGGVTIGWRASCFFVVPNGNYYEVIALNNSGSLSTWVEWPYVQATSTSSTSSNFSSGWVFATSSNGEYISSPDQVQQNWMMAVFVYFCSLYLVVWLMRKRH